MSENKPKTSCSVLCPELVANKRINTASVNGNVLATILNAKVAWLEAKQKECPLDDFKDNLEPADRSFYHTLRAGKTRFILECKKASPSKGLIRPDFNPAEIAKVYDKYASAISVLTDEKFFQGSYDYINVVRKEVHVPVLCKDFIYDPYQVYLARKSGADAILLMLSVLTDEAYTELRDIAHRLHMGVLTEASTETEIRRAIKLNAQIIGINNRNLRNLTVDLNRVKELSKLVPEDRVVISESGIYTHDQILDLSDYAKGFLVGSSLTAEKDIELACRRLINGENKVCGITKSRDAINCWHAGVVYNGLIFASKSPRCVTATQAKQIISATRQAGGKQKFVGVFVNEPIENVVALAYELDLAVIQLHGNEDIAYINSLKDELPINIEIWKAIPIEDSYPEDIISNYLQHTHKVLLDSKNMNGFGGTGKTFDWNLIPNTEKSRIILAGGLTPDNVKTAYKVSKVVGLDMNSGLETAPGIKDEYLIEKAFIEVKDF